MQIRIMFRRKNANRTYSGPEFANNKLLFIITI